MGIIEKAEGNFERAIDYFQQALAIQKDIGGRLGIASNLSNVGSTFDAQENFAQAQEFHLEALAILRAERSAQGEGRVYTFTYLVTNTCGATTTVTVTVTVPLNQGN